MGWLWNVCNRSQHKDCITKEINKVYLDNFVMDTLTKNLFSTYSIDKISDSLKEYRSYQASKRKKDLQLYNQKLEQITKDIDSLISLAIRNNVNSESLKEKLTTLEHNKITLEFQIKRLTTDIKLEKCETLLHKAIADSKHYFKFHDISRAKLVINEYIEKVVVSNSTVSIYFKINIPDENMVLNPLVVVTDRENIYNQYRPAI